MHREFPPIAFLAAVFLLIPLPSHWRAGNVATISIICWLLVCNIIYGADAIIWGNNVNIVAPVWCDITSKIIIGANFALPAACLCICIHLEKVSSMRVARVTQSDKRRRQVFEMLMCFGLPILFMALHYVVQGHRFDIIEEYGCRPTTYISIPGIIIVWIPPLVLSAVCLIFAGLALRHFIHRRMTFAMHLAASNSALNTSRYMRLILMSITQMFWSISVTSYTLWFTLNSVPMRPWTTWSDVHSNFSQIDLYVTAFTPKVVVTSYYVLWWMVPASSIVFIIFFAFGRDAVEEYKSYFRWFRTRALRHTLSDGSSKGTFGSLPIWNTNRSNIIPISTTSSQAPPPYKAPSQPAPTKYKNSLDDLNIRDDSYSETSHGSYPTDYKGMGTSPTTPSTSTLSAHTPSAFSPATSSFVFSPPGVAETEMTFAPMSPPFSHTPPPHTYVRSSISRPPTSPRPFTYPSVFDATRTGIARSFSNDKAENG